MEFTKEELYEIETRFDHHAGATAHVMGILTQRLSINQKAKKLLDRILDEAVDNYDMFRTISAKCKLMREKKE